MYIIWTDRWQWDIKRLIEARNSPIIYKVHNDMIYLFFQNQDELKNRHVILCYLDYQRIFNILPKNKGKGTYCPFCNTYRKSTTFYFNGEEFNVCDQCRYTPSPYTNIYINEKFEGLKYTVDYILTYQHKLYYFYHMVVKQEDFNYQKIIYQPWYQMTSSQLCDQCQQHDKYYHSYCKSCYYFAYHEIYNQHLCKYALIKNFQMPLELINMIMDLILLIINIKVSVDQLYFKPITKLDIDLNKIDLDNKVEEDLNKIDLDNKVEEVEEDLITEDNMNFYLSDDDYEVDAELGTWSDDY